jgi:pimeloyl-ACP methyl ester carboxylesterase
MPYTELDGIRSYYEIHGQGAPVLLLHGGFCSLETWRAQLPALAAAYQVHAPERPGHGRSADRDGPFRYADMVADTIRYLDAVGLDDANVIGFSDGAIISLLLALEHPERVRSIVAISANLNPDVFADTGDEPAEEDEARGGSDVRAAYEKLSPDGPGHCDVILDKLHTLWTSEPDIAAADLAAICAPALIMAGDRDSIPTDHTVLIARSIPRARLAIVPDAGHMVIEEQPDEVNRLVLRFLSGLSAAT